MAFDFHKVRNDVAERVAIVGRVDETLLHELYYVAIKEELSRAAQRAEEVRLLITSPQILKAKHRTGAWVMVDGKAWDEVQGAFRNLVGELR